MSSDNIITQVQGGMRVLTIDGVTIGHVWRVHMRDTETCIEIRPRTFWNAVLEALILRPLPTNSHLFLPAQTITHVVNTQVYVRIAAEAARAYSSRPPWIERDPIPPTGFNSGRLD
jgi:hypothetical protein